MSLITQPHSPALGVQIFDVGHGSCSLVTCPNGSRIMVGCGYRLDPPWFPSVSFRNEWIDTLAFDNLDEDHLDDLPYVWRDIRLGSIFTNPTVTADALAAMKRKFGMSDGVKLAHSILARHGTGLIGQVGCSGQVRAWAYYNAYGEFTDTNNLSLAIFITYGAFTILFAGDLEEPGWRALLRSPYFRADLAKVTVFVTSHHGRDNGCCDELFEICTPAVFVASDDAIQYETQNTTEWYRQRALGIPDYRFRLPGLSGHPKRYVLTTRRDGMLSIQATPNGGFLITPEKGGPQYAPGLSRFRAA